MTSSVAGRGLFGGITDSSLCKIYILHNVTDNVLFEWFLRSDQSNGKEALLLRRKEIGSDGLEWIHQAQDRDQRWADQNTVINLGLP